VSVTQVWSPAEYVEIKWNAPVDGNIIGYYVYKQNENGSLEVVNGSALIGETKFRDDQFFEGNVRYVVRAVGLLNSSSGSFYDLSVPVEQTLRVTPVTDDVAGDGVRLHCYPNPARNATSIDFTLATPARVNVSVYNSAGNRIRTLETRTLAAGEQHLSWDLLSSLSERVSQGIYVLRVAIGDKVFVGKISVVE
jgi:hypothetical protein